MAKRKIDKELIVAELGMSLAVLEALEEAELRKLTSIADTKKKKREGTYKKPKRDGSKTTEPIKKEKWIHKILDALENDRDKLLFMMGILTGLRISDIVPLTAGQVRSILSGVNEKKTDKYKRVYFNVRIREIIDGALAGLTDDECVFRSRKYKANAENREGGATHISTEQAWKILKKAAKKCRYPGNLSAHALRKTFGYWNYKAYEETRHTKNPQGCSIETLQIIFNHDSPRTTLTYIGITQEEINRVYKNVHKLFGL